MSLKRKYHHDQQGIESECYYSFRLKVTITSVSLKSLGIIQHACVHDAHQR